MGRLKHKTFWKSAALTLGVLAFFFAGRLMPGEGWVEDLIAGLEAKGPTGMVVFSAVYIMAMVGFVWGTPFTLAAGAAFGVWWGTAVSVFSATSGSAIAFLIGRYLAREAIEHWAESNAKFKAIDAAIGRFGWKVVFLTRFSPVIPFAISNYLFGLTKVGFWSFVWASAGAIAPGSFIVAYLGHVGRLAILDQWEGLGARHYVLMGGALVFTTLLVIYLARVARRAVAEVNARKAAGER